MAERHIPVKMNHLCCRICRNLLRNPATVPCGHNFCMRCIQDRWDREELKNNLCRCPECDYEFSSRPQLIRNTTLAEVVRDTEMSYSKKKEEEEEEQQVPKRPRSCTETSGSTLCWRHNKPLDVYCCTDEQIICAQCTSAEHGGHRIGWVKEERRRKQVQKTGKNNLPHMCIKQDEARQTEAFCESVVVGVIDSLQKHYLSVKELIAAQEEAAAAQVRVSLQSLEVEMKEMKKRDAELDHLAQTESNIHFLQKWPSLKLICDRLCSFHEASEDPLLPFELTKRAVEHLGRELEEFCDKEFASICQTASNSHPRGLYLKLFPEKNCFIYILLICVSLLTLYACELSLDPTTAHEDLAISEGEKEVMLCHQRSKNPGVRYPERFIHRRQVLCREGLQGNCYYEVEVKGDKAEIALAYKGIDRKSRNKLSAFGANANSWSLDRSKNYSVSHNSESILLTTPPSHHRIGVYLKFQNGTLSFYEVSDSMNFLYKVEAKFREPLYPGFWLGEKSCIRLCDLTQNRL
uniref:Tripartite motif containing 16 n=1 Tax=Amphilophus citrinellus TaxID=61819 RepID=A0A3Q0SV00_AMPCI